MEIEVTTTRNTISGDHKATVLVESINPSELIYAVECRATLSGAPWGRGVGVDVLADDLQTDSGVYELPTPAQSFSFDVESSELLSGDGTYRITVYVRDSRGVWDDTFLFIPSGSDMLKTADGKVFKCKRG